MAEPSLDDDDLFGEAADDLRGEIEDSLDDARAALPNPDAVWEADADNVLGVLNGLRGSMDTEQAREHLREAKKWYTMAQRAHAFHDAGDVQAELESVESTIEDLAAAREQISDLAGTVPELRSDLEDIHTEVDDSGADATPAASGNGATPESDGSETGDTGTDGDSPDAATEDGDESSADDGDDDEQATLEDQ